MKKLITVFLLLGFVRTVRAEPEFIFKTGYSFNGKLALSNEKFCPSGSGCISAPDSSSSVSNTPSVSFEIQQFSAEQIGLGVGVTYQVPRKPSDFDGEFNFIPMYGFLKLRSIPDQSNSYFYVVGQLGYNAFLGDEQFKGDGGTLSSGLYFGFGGGLTCDRLTLELLYTADQGSAEAPGCVPGFGVCGTAKTDMEYSALTFNLAYKWGGDNQRKEDSSHGLETQSQDFTPVVKEKNPEVLQTFQDIKKGDRLKITTLNGKDVAGTFIQWDYNNPDKFWMKADGDFKGRTRPYYVSDLTKAEH